MFIAAVSRGNLIPRWLASELYEMMPRQVVPNAGALEFVEAVGRSGAKLAIVSNTGLDIRPSLERWGIAGHSTKWCSLSRRIVPSRTRVFSNWRPRRAFATTIKSLEIAEDLG